jgi:serine/threonine-protein kinase
MARVVLTVSSGPAGVRKLLVVKQIRPELVHDAEFVDMFLDEARLAARLSHPNVIQTYEVGIDDSGPFIVMEYLDGQSLQALIGKVRRSNMPLGLHLAILGKVLAGLHYAHELKDYNGARLSVVHRDVSPQNVFIGYDGQVKVVDFGVAKVAGTADRTAAGTFKGKIGYIAPEQLSGAEIDRRADIFSVGVMLWEALARRRFTANETAASAVHKRLQGALSSVKSADASVPDELAAICDRATAFSPSDRYATAAEMREAIETYVDRAGMRADDREVGALVARAFDDERARIRAAIEQQIGTAVDPEKIAMPNLGIEKPAGSFSPTGTSSNAPPSFTATRSDFAPAAAKSRWVAVAGLVALIGLTVVLVGRWTAMPALTTAASSAASVVATPAAPAPAEAPIRVTITLTIRVTPPQATLQLDGAELPTNPFHSAVPKDSIVHKLTASAPGYATEERLLQFDEDGIIDLVLKRGRARPAAPGATNDEAPAPGGDLKKVRHPTRSLDEEDPYQ